MSYFRINCNVINNLYIRRLLLLPFSDTQHCGLSKKIGTVVRKIYFVQKNRDYNLANRNKSYLKAHPRNEK